MRRHDSPYVIVASFRWGRRKSVWYNVVKNPRVRAAGRHRDRHSTREVFGDEGHLVAARRGSLKAGLAPATQTKTDRQIPVFVLTPARAASHWIGRRGTDDGVRRTG